MLASTSRVGMGCRGSSATLAGRGGAAALPRARTQFCPSAAARAPPRLVAAAPSRAPPKKHPSSLSVAAAAATKKDDNPSPAPPPSDATKKRFDAMLAQLRSTGLNQEKARRLLKAWAKAGALEPEALKQLLLRRALTPARALGIQAAIDALAGVVGFASGASIGRAEEFPFQILAQVACYFGGMWYVISGLSGGSALVQVLLAARRYASSADALLAAVQLLAGPEAAAAAAAEASSSGGVGVGRVAANLSLAVNAAKVVAALDAIAGQLRAMDAEEGASSKKSTLINLAAFCTLQHAEEKEGLVPGDYGLSEKEATDIARVFAMYDRNENFVLDPEELGAMVRELGRDLSDAEVKEAARLMAGDAASASSAAAAAAAGPRGVTFSQFVGWWTGRRPADKKAPARAA
jgi:hypothetical protein